jgi:2-keto-3-deoxy-L-rhamnonate aldolase RhmA
MDLPVNLFKKNLLRTPPQIGTWISSTSPWVAEAMGCAGFEWLVVDMEHTPLDFGPTVAIMQAIAGTPAQAVVRLPWNDRVMTKRALDAGAQTIMFPYVQTVEEAQAAVASTRYPPKGARGISSTHRASRFGTVPNYLKRAAEEICVIVQIETPEALSRMAQIAELDGVDALFVGPGDLSGAMGHIGDIANPKVQRKLAEGAQIARDAGKGCGIVGSSPALVHSYIDMGYTYVAVASDIGMMMSKAAEILAAMKAKPKG